MLTGRALSLIFLFTAGCGAASSSGGPHGGDLSGSAAGDLSLQTMHDMVGQLGGDMSNAPPGDMTVPNSPDMACNTAISWKGVGQPARAQITGGPWTLGTPGAPMTGILTAFPPNKGTNDMMPYYFPFTTGTDKIIQGLFDYRPHDVGEAVVAAQSMDGGKHWTFQDEVSMYVPAVPTDDDGEGHPNTITVGGKVFLYTLDRTPEVKNIGGLIVHMVTPINGHPLSGVPANETPPSKATTRTTGLLNPDGILCIVPGLSPVTVMYLQKQLDPNGFTTMDKNWVRLATTTNGVDFVDIGEATGLMDNITNFIAPRGTILRYGPSSYGLFYAGGVMADGDSDAFHYIGYATSSDLKTWTPVNGRTNAIVSRDMIFDSTGGPQPWYQGRVYAPTVTASADCRSATLIFAGYHTPKPSQDLIDYRQIGVLPLVRADSCPVEPNCGGM